MTDQRDDKTEQEDLRETIEESAQDPSTEDVASGASALPPRSAEMQDSPDALPDAEAEQEEQDEDEAQQEGN
jgi:hypothetical protein